MANQEASETKKMADGPASPDLDLDRDQDHGHGREQEQEQEKAGEPELETAPERANPAVPAVVPPPTGFIQGRITRYLQRALEGVPRPPVEPPTELLERLDGVEVQMAAIEELVAKRLEEGEGRTLHLVEKRLEVLQEEIASVACRAVEGQVEDEVRALRRLIAGIGAFAIGLSAAALLVALGVL